MRVGLVLGAVGVGVLAVAATAGDARACGGCFHEPSQSGDVITDHRMIFRVTPQATTLYDEIKYGGNPASFAWVLPIHGPVTVGLSSDILFAAIDAATQTTIEPPQLPACPSCLCGSSGGALGAAPGSGSSSGGGGGVTVISQMTVGPYDTVQLQSSNPNALSAWLTANGYDLPASVQPVVAAYVKEGFDFLALRLQPGQGVSAMRPVRVTSPGAGLALPLRMVAAGTGPIVGITLWVVGDGRYEPQNFKSFVISPSQLVWDFGTSISNYTTVRAQTEASFGNAAWQIESSLPLSPTQVEAPITAQPASANYLAIPASDAGADGGGGGGETADQVEMDDLATMFPAGSMGTLRVTRMRADLAHAALANDLVLQASSDQGELSNLYQVTQSVNAPACPAMPDPCPPCDTGSSSGLGFGGSSGTTSNGSGHSGCATAPESGSGGTGVELVVAGLAAVGIFGSRARRRKR